CPWPPSCCRPLRSGYSGSSGFPIEPFRCRGRCPTGEAADRLAWTAHRCGNRSKARIVRILHVTPYMHPRAGGPPAVVENFVREAIRLGHSAEIMSTSLFCLGDEGALARRLNELAPTVIVPGSSRIAPVSWSVRRRLGESIRAADIVHLHTV